MKLLGLTGPKGSGKDTCAELIDAIPRKPYQPLVHYALANPIKEAAKVIFDWPDEMIYEPGMKDIVDDRYPVTPRTALQTLGTEWPRILGCPRIWVKRADEEKSKLEEEYTGGLMIVPDIRRQFEADWIYEHKGYIFCVDRPGYDYTHEHETEVSLHPDYISAYIYNHQDTPFLMAQLVSLVDTFYPGVFDVEGSK